MVDTLTGWPMAKTIPDKEATAVARAVYEKLMLEHGSPEILLSDNGKEFANNTLAYVCEEFCIEQHFTSPYTPMSNGTNLRGQGCMGPGSRPNIVCL